MGRRRGRRVACLFGLALVACGGGKDAGHAPSQEESPQHGVPAAEPAATPSPPSPPPLESVSDACARGDAKQCRALADRWGVALPPGRGAFPLPGNPSILEEAPEGALVEVVGITRSGIHWREHHGLDRDTFMAAFAEAHPPLKKLALVLVLADETLPFGDLWPFHEPRTLSAFPAFALAKPDGTVVATPPRPTALRMPGFGGPSKLRAQLDPDGVTLRNDSTRRETRVPWAEATFARIREVQEELRTGRKGGLSIVVWVRPDTPLGRVAELTELLDGEDCGVTAGGCQLQDLAIVGQVADATP